MCIKSLVTSHFIGFQEKLDFEEVKIIHITAIVLNNANDKSIQVFKRFLQWTVIQHFVTVHPEKGVQSKDGSFIKRSDQNRGFMSQSSLWWNYKNGKQWADQWIPMSICSLEDISKLIGLLTVLKYAYLIYTCSRSSKGLLVHALK